MKKLFSLGLFILASQCFAMHYANIDVSGFYVFQDNLIVEA